MGILLIIFIILIVAVVIPLLLKKAEDNDKAKVIEEQKKLAVEELRKKEENQENLQREIEAKNNNTEYLRSIITDITSKVNAFRELLHHPNGYASGYLTYNCKLYFESGNFNDFMIKNFRNSFLNEDELIKFEFYNKISARFHHLVKLSNQKYYEAELKNNEEFFSDVDGKSLDEQQRASAISDEDNTLVVAGAGSGKTATIAGKVAYLVKRKNILPDDILLISFTKKSSNEMSERIRSKMKIAVDVKTFNKLGLDIIKSVDVENQKSVCSLSESQLKQLYNSFFQNNLSDCNYLRKFNDFFITHSQEYISPFNFKDQKKYFEHIKSQNLKGLKVIEGKTSKNETYLYQEEFKSKEEVEIANFLYLNRINYEYEKGYKVRTASEKFGQYKPDFYLPDYGIYIEHFGIDRNGNVPGWFSGDGEKSAKEKYNEGIAWKRALHQENDTELLETYSYEKKEGSLLKNLEAKLRHRGVTFKPMNENEILQEIKEKKSYEYNEFSKLLITFTNLFKSNRSNVKELYNTVQNAEDSRTIAFLELWQPIFEAYQEYLLEKSEIDFTDMINNATDYVNAGLYSQAYKYIIIDEFQDISVGRYKLIKALLDINPASKLFCVGDDWQSIYRFSGSDISIFTNFSEYFETSPIKDFRRNTSRFNIEKTYRFKQDLISQTSDFILKNKSQLPKNLISAVKENNIPSINIINLINSTEISSKIIETLNEIKTRLNENGEDINKKKVIFLGRYSHDLQKLKDCPDVKISKNFKDGKSLISIPSVLDNNAEFLTVHSAKGLEADYVFLLNVNSGKYGFPSQIADDSVLHYLLSHTDDYPNSEERRLFYVALTRCREQIYLMVENDLESIFLNEFSGKNQRTSYCPSCEIGRLNLKKGKYGFYFSCNNTSQCIYTKPANIEDLYEEACISFKAKNISYALKLFEECAAKNKKYKKTLRNIALCYAGVNKEKANKYLLEAIKLDNDTFARRERIMLNIPNLDYGFALEDLNECISKNYDEPQLRFYRAVKLYKEKKYHEALKDCEVCINNEYDLINTYSALAICYMGLGNKTQALFYFKKSRDCGEEGWNKKISELESVQEADNDEIYFNETPKYEAPKVASIEYKKIMITNAINADVKIKFIYSGLKLPSISGPVKVVLIPKNIVPLEESNDFLLNGKLEFATKNTAWNLSKMSNIELLS